MKAKTSMVRSLYFETKDLFETYAKFVSNQCWNFSNFFFFCKVNNENLQNFKKTSFNLFFIKTGILFLFKEKLSLINFVIKDALVFCSLNINSLLQFYSLHHTRVKVMYVCTPTGFFFFSTVLHKIKRLNTLVHFVSIFKLRFFFRDLFLLSLILRKISFISNSIKLKLYSKLINK